MAMPEPLITDEELAEIWPAPGTAAHSCSELLMDPNDVPLPPLTRLEAIGTVLLYLSGVGFVVLMLIAGRDHLPTLF